MTNTLELKAAMIKKGYTSGTLADEIGLSRQSMSYKINNHREFTVSEINAICKALDLDLEQKELIFFGQ